ncbi:DUF4233 domain-containing protein [Glycomyces artemisiae]|uniref:Uncharacterized protein DUF4233 n=1 Tax=Glycomyces artemisiae TaxID=1076443 RepID=A0A2T0UV51_9ACTN|nr:DUF4233 domain-containing protein [Glycomyces artemisiae]PRY61728.1 uncharacterized protein DUF4233 [Glycomyces artemisiae]
MAERDEHPETPEEAEAPWEAEPDPNRSGLRDPARAARSLAAVALAFEALALLMAIVPMRMILDEPTPATVAVIVLVIAAVALAGMAKRPWVWPAGAVLQLAVIACWPIHWSLGVAGLIFACVWLYCWHVKRQLALPPKR